MSQYAQSIRFSTARIPTNSASEYGVQLPTGLSQEETSKDDVQNTMGLWQEFTSTSAKNNAAKTANLHTSSSPACAPLHSICIAGERVMRFSQAGVCWGVR